MSHRPGAIDGVRSGAAVREKEQEQEQDDSQVLLLLFILLVILFIILILILLLLFRLAAMPRMTTDKPCIAMTEAKLPDRPNVSLADFQALIRKMYFEKDQARGVEGTFLWLMEEVGELATALRNGTHEERLGEFADVLAWLTTIANVAGVDLSEAVARKYGSGCPGCGQFICVCPDSEKP